LRSVGFCSGNRKVVRLLMVSWKPWLCAAFSLLALANLAEAQTVHSIAGKTYRTWSGGHGSQIQYVGPRGLWAFLWYPGNRVIVPSKWRPAPFAGQPGKCELWPENTYNPTAPNRATHVECTTERAWQARILEVASGDIFGLAHDPRVVRPTPFPLPREPLTFAQIRQMMRDQPR
jgi:hypothetical protein